MIVPQRSHKTDAAYMQLAYVSVVQPGSGQVAAVEVTAFRSYSLNKQKVSFTRFDCSHNERALVCISSIGFITFSLGVWNLVHVYPHARFRV